MEHQPNFEDWLEERFIEFNEIGGVIITKDNCETMFENWLEGLDVSEIIEWADKYGAEQRRIGREQLKEELLTN